MKFRPVADRIVVEPIAAEAATPGGIALQDSVQDSAREAHRGLVLAVGPGVRCHDGTTILECSVKAGDEVYFNQYAGTTLKLNGSEVRVICESDVLVVVEK